MTGALILVSAIGVSAVGAAPGDTTGDGYGNGGTVDHVLIRSISFSCSRDNTAQLNTLPAILIYNPTKKDVKGSGWTLRSTNGTLVTFKNPTTFDSKDNFDLKPDLKKSKALIYSGDHLGLYDKAGNLVDGISWGTDTTQLMPPIAGAVAGERFRRISLKTDTDTNADWAVTVRRSCSR